MKVCFHVDQNERWSTCLANVYNTFKYADENQEEIPMVVIANSEAVSQLADREENKAFLTELQTYMDQGLVVQACQNALKGQDLTADDLPQGMEVVPAGIIALAQKQDEGYAYIRP